MRCVDLPTSCSTLTLYYSTVLIASLRSSIALSGVFFWLTITFMLLGIAEFVPAHAVGIKTAGGAFGLITAFNAWSVPPSHPLSASC